MSIALKFSFLLFITFYLLSTVIINDDVNECDYFLQNVQNMIMYRLMHVNRFPFHTLIHYTFPLVLLSCFQCHIPNSLLCDVVYKAVNKQVFTSLCYQ